MTEASCPEDLRILPRAHELVDPDELVDQLAIEDEQALNLLRLRVHQSQMRARDLSFAIFNARDRLIVSRETEELVRYIEGAIANASYFVELLRKAKP